MMEWRRRHEAMEVCKINCTQPYRSNDQRLWELETVLAAICNLSDENFYHRLNDKVNQLGKKIDKVEQKMSDHRADVAKKIDRVEEIVCDHDEARQRAQAESFHSDMLKEKEYEMINNGFKAMCRRVPDSYLERVAWAMPDETSSVEEGAFSPREVRVQRLVNCLQYFRRTRVLYHVCNTKIDEVESAVSHQGLVLRELHQQVEYLQELLEQELEEKRDEGMKGKPLEKELEEKRAESMIGKIQNALEVICNAIHNAMQSAVRKRNLDSEGEEGPPNNKRRKLND